MKKLVAIVAVSALLITGNISFALGTQPEDKPVKNVQSAQVGQIGDDKKDIQKEIKSILKEDIFPKRQSIIAKKADLRQTFLTVKNHIKELRKDNKDIDTAELKLLLETIKDERLKLNNAIADCAKEIHALRMAKKNGNTNEIKNILDNISKLQSDITADLEEIDKSLDKILQE
jgi:peptidoglycan hydrolase CwlO-like protein